MPSQPPDHGTGRWYLRARSTRGSRIQNGTDGAFAALSVGLPETPSHSDLLSKTQPRLSTPMRLPNRKVGGERRDRGGSSSPQVL